MALHYRPVDAQPMQDGLVKAGGSGEFGIRVQGIAVATEPVQQRLLRQYRHVDLQVRRPVRRAVRR